MRNSFLARLLLATMLIVSASGSTAASDTVRLAMIDGVPALTKAPAEIIRQAYRSIGLDVELVAMPVARSLTEADKTYGRNRVCISEITNTSETSG